MCAFDLFLKNELSNCVLSISLAVYLFFASFLGCLWVAVLSPSLDFYVLRRNAVLLFQ